MITVKTERELKLMREPCKILRDTLLHLESKICVGMTTKELDKIAHDYIVSYGAKPSFLGLYGFPGSICISIDEEVVHGFPSDRIIKDGEIVSVDVGVHLNGFHGDAARSFCVGNISPEQKRLVEVTKECFFKGIEDVCVGSTIGDIGSQVQAHAEANGYSVVREMVGHGIGRKVHEDPSVPNYGRAGTGIRIRKGMTLAIEPMINMGRHEIILNGWSCKTKDGLPSAHYENTVAFTDDGVEILTL